MLWIVMAFGVLTVGIGGYAIVSPPSLARWAERFLAGPGILGGVVLRLLLAVALWFGASESRTPAAFQVLGALSLLGALILPVLGKGRLEAIIRWGVEQPAWLVRAWCSLAVVLGVFLLWSAGSAA